MQADYSIIVPAYNEAVELPTTLESVRHAMNDQLLKGECIVVDNNSTDKTSEIAEKYGTDQVVFESVNQISRARNAGAKASNGRYLIFVDADTRIDSILLKETLKLLDSGDYAGGGALLEFEGKTSMVGHFGITLWKYISQWSNTAAGSFLFCRRDAFEAIGGFDLKLYASEEIRFSRLLRKWGKQNKQDFTIINKTSAQTSARKLEWYGSARILLGLLFLPLTPIIVRFRALCWFWYNRPV